MQHIANHLWMASSFSQPSGWCESYAGLIGFNNPRWLKALQRRWASTQQTLLFLYAIPVTSSVKALKVTKSSKPPNQGKSPTDLILSSSTITRFLRLKSRSFLYNSSPTPVTRVNEATSSYENVKCYNSKLTVSYWPRVIKAPRSSQPDCVRCSDNRLFWFAVRSSSSAIANICCKYITVHIWLSFNRPTSVLDTKKFRGYKFMFMFNWPSFLQLFQKRLCGHN